MSDLVTRLRNQMPLPEPPACSMPPPPPWPIEQVIRQTEERVEDEALAMMNAAASEREKLRLELYMAFLSSALAMGKDIQKLSWFGKNHVATMPTVHPQP